MRGVMNKLGKYVSSLMTVVLDKEQDEFVKNLALSELKSINADVEGFIRKNSPDESENIVNTFVL